MKDIIKYISILILIAFSFYYTDKISTLIIYNSELMKEIVNHKSHEEVKAISALINGQYIIPGINGLKVNELDSYYQMKAEYEYNKGKLVFDDVEPETSIEKNKHLIINKGNRNKKAVSIILHNNDEILNYIKKENIKVSTLIKYDEFNKDSFAEQINYDNDMKKLDILLDKYKVNTNICYVTSDNKEECIKRKKYLVEPTYYMNNLLVISIDITSGDIYFIDDNMSLSSFKQLIKKINYRNLDIVYLSELISEKRSD